MQSFFDRVQRATVEEETLRAVLLIDPEYPRDKHPSGDGVLWKSSRVAKDNEAASTQQLEERAVFGASNEESRLRDETTHARAVELWWITRPHSEAERLATRDSLDAASRPDVTTVPSNPATTTVTPRQQPWP